MYTLEFDGLFKGLRDPQQPVPVGLMCYGWLISKDGVMVAHGYGAFARGKHASSNIAEYLAMIEGLEALLDMGVMDEPVVVYGDAKSVIQHMQGTASVNAEHIKKLHNRAMRLSRKFRRIHWIWKPRKYNREADALSRRAMRQIGHDRKRFRDLVSVLAASIGRAPHSSRLLPVSDLRVYLPYSV
jgi:ribonuclease HI